MKDYYYDTGFPVLSEPHPYKNPCREIMIKDYMPAPSPRGTGRTLRLVNKIVEAYLSEEKELNIYILASHKNVADFIYKGVIKVVDALGVPNDRLREHGLTRTFYVYGTKDFSINAIVGRRNIRVFVDHSVYEQTMAYKEWNILNNLLNSAKVLH